MNLHEKPLWQLTASEFLILTKELFESDYRVNMEKDEELSSRNYVYGIAGIAKHLNCSKSKVSRIKDTILKPALIENGRSIIADADHIMELYNQNEEYKKA